MSANKDKDNDKEFNKIDVDSAEDGPESPMVVDLEQVLERQERLEKALQTFNAARLSISPEKSSTQNKFGSSLTSYNTTMNLEASLNQIDDNDSMLNFKYQKVKKELSDANEEISLLKRRLTQREDRLRELRQVVALELLQIQMGGADNVKLRINDKKKLEENEIEELRADIRKRDEVIVTKDSKQNILSEKIIHLNEKFKDFMKIKEKEILSLTENLKAAEVQKNQLQKTIVGKNGIIEQQLSNINMLELDLSHESKSVATLNTQVISLTQQLTDESTARRIAEDGPKEDAEFWSKIVDEMNIEKQNLEKELKSSKHVCNEMQYKYEKLVIELDELVAQNAFLTRPTNHKQKDDSDIDVDRSESEMASHNSPSGGRNRRKRGSSRSDSKGTNYNENNDDDNGNSNNSPQPPSDGRPSGGGGRKGTAMRNRASSSTIKDNNGDTNDNYTDAAAEEKINELTKSLEEYKEKAARAVNSNSFLLEAKSAAELQVKSLSQQAELLQEEKKELLLKIAAAEAAVESNVNARRATQQDLAQSVARLGEMQKERELLGLDGVDPIHEGEESDDENSNVDHEHDGDQHHGDSSSNRDRGKDDEDGTSNNKNNHIMISSSKLPELAAKPTSPVAPIAPPETEEIQQLSKFNDSLEIGFPASPEGSVTSHNPVPTTTTTTTTTAATDNHNNMSGTRGVIRAHSNSNNNKTTKEVFLPYPDGASESITEEMQQGRPGAPVPDTPDGSIVRYASGSKVNKKDQYGQYLVHSKPPMRNVEVQTNPTDGATITTNNNNDHGNNNINITKSDLASKLLESYEFHPPASPHHAPSADDDFILGPLSSYNPNSNTHNMPTNNNDNDNDNDATDKNHNIPRPSAYDPFTHYSDRGSPLPHPINTGCQTILQGNDVAKALMFMVDDDDHGNANGNQLSLGLGLGNRGVASNGGFQQVEPDIHQMNDHQVKVLNTDNGNANANVNGDTTNKNTELQEGGTLEQLSSAYVVSPPSKYSKYIYNSRNNRKPFSHYTEGLVANKNIQAQAETKNKFTQFDKYLASTSGASRIKIETRDSACQIDNSSVLELCLKKTFKHIHRYSMKYAPVTDIKPQPWMLALFGQSKDDVISAELKTKAVQTGSTVPQKIANTQKVNTKPSAIVMERRMKKALLFIEDVTMLRHRLIADINTKVSFNSSHSRAVLVVVDLIISTLHNILSPWGRVMQEEFPELLETLQVTPLENDNQTDTPVVGVDVGDDDVKRHATLDDIIFNNSNNDQAATTFITEYVYENSNNIDTSTVNNSTTNNKGRGNKSAFSIGTGHTQDYLNVKTMVEHGHIPGAYTDSDTILEVTEKMNKNAISVNNNGTKGTFEVKLPPASVPISVDKTLRNTIYNSSNNNTDNTDNVDNANNHRGNDGMSDSIVDDPENNYSNMQQQQQQQKLSGKYPPSDLKVGLGPNEGLDQASTEVQVALGDTDDDNINNLGNTYDERGEQDEALGVDYRVYSPNMSQVSPHPIGMVYDNFHNLVDDKANDDLRMNVSLTYYLNNATNLNADVTNNTNTDNNNYHKDSNRNRDSNHPGVPAPAPVVPSPITPIKGKFAYLTGNKTNLPIKSNTTATTTNNNNNNNNNNMLNVSPVAMKANLNSRYYNTTNDATDRGGGIATSHLPFPGKALSLSANAANIKKNLTSNSNNNSRRSPSPTTTLLTLNPNFSTTAPAKDGHNIIHNDNTINIEFEQELKESPLRWKPLKMKAIGDQMTNSKVVYE